MSECNICIEKYTKVTRKQLQCPACSYNVCTNCMKQYIINNTTEEAHCMNCKVRFTNDFLNNHFTNIIP